MAISRTGHAGERSPAGRFSPELELCLACCRWPHSAETGQRVRAAAAAGLDWQRFSRLVARHRIEGLAFRALSRAHAPAPAAVVGGLAESSAAIAAGSLVYAAEAVRLFRLFGDAGVELLFLKGATLARLAYGTLLVKGARDIDAVVAASDFERAFAVLAGAGYRRVDPGPAVSDEALGAWARRSHETVWLSDSTGVVVEIQSEFSGHPALLRSLSMESPRQWVETASGVKLPTLAGTELFSYLCVHGAVHGWSRLKWLADLAALLRACDAVPLAGLYRDSQRMGAGRAAGQALLLCARLLAIVLPEDMAREIEDDRATRRLARAAVRRMENERGHEETVFGTVPIHLDHFALQPGLRHKLATARQKSLLRLPAWLRRRVAARFARR
jgi:hypothetical protein